MTKLNIQKGMQIGPWRLEKSLGAGGQAEVWKARHPTEKHAPAVALKLCLHTDDKARARFLQEVALLKQYAHSAIVRLRAHGQHIDSPTAHRFPIFCDGPCHDDATLRVEAGTVTPALATTSMK